MNKLLWVFVIIALLNIASTAIVFQYLQSQIESGVSGTEYFFFMFPQLGWFFYLRPYMLILGGISAISLSFHGYGKAKRITLVILGVLLLMGSIWNFILVNNTNSDYEERTEEHNRVMSQSETNSLIANCEIDSFSLQASRNDERELVEDMQEVYVFYVENYDADGEWDYKPKYAEPSGYGSYVKTAQESQNDCEHQITYMNDFGNNDPESEGHRWIDSSEAASLLDNCEIKTFTYTKPTLGDEEASGEETGIKLIDHGFVKHLVIAQEWEDELIPIARDAQDKCGEGTNYPQFWYHGRYEQNGDGV